VTSAGPSPPDFGAGVGAGRNPLPGILAAAAIAGLARVLDVILPGTIADVTIARSSWA